MTEQEAIKRLEFLNDALNFNRADSDESSCALQMAIKALEKQIPKKIVYRKQFYGTPYFCPECFADQCKVEFTCIDGSKPKEKHSFCWKCGCKLDWSDENDI